MFREKEAGATHVRRGFPVLGLRSTPNSKDAFPATLGHEAPDPNSKPRDLTAAHRSLKPPSPLERYSSLSEPVPLFYPKSGLTTRL